MCCGENISAAFAGDRADKDFARDRNGLPGPGAIYRSQTLRFLLPVYLGETVTAHFVVRSVDRAKHRLEIEAWIENEAGRHVIEGTCEAGLLHQ